MKLAHLYKSSESIGAPYQPSANAAMRELERRSGKTVVVLAPYGGSRTDAEGRRINRYLNPRLSDHNYRKARALDVNNRGQIIAGLATREGLTWAAAERLYYAIWAKYGWRNIQIDGSPFPVEPWHLANHSSHPQGSAGVPIAGQPKTMTEEDNMFLLYNSKTNQAIYRPGKPLKRITDAQAAGYARLLKQLDIQPDSDSLTKARTKVDNEAWGLLVELEGIE